MILKWGKNNVQLIRMDTGSLILLLIRLIIINICGANQLTGFHMRATLAFNGLI